MKITALKTFQLSGQAQGKWSGQECRLARPLDIYPEFRDEGPHGGRSEYEGTRRVQHLFVEVLTDEGPAGLYGPIAPPQAFFINSLLRPLLVGRDPLPVEKLWDLMSRVNRHGRTGPMMMAISAVDCALWDLRGKVFGAPVYQLLGGPTREEVPAYASMLGFSHEPELLRERALKVRDKGFAAQKWFFHHGPGSGRQGLAQNVALVRGLRETLGDDYDLMLDCWTSWDTPYAIAMAEEILPLRPTWVEEPLPPNRLDGFVRLKNETGLPIAAGEHLHTRWEIKPFLDAGVLDFLQADPEWTGGITELVKICALAAVYDVKVVPHGCGMPAALHVVASQSPGLCPMVEYLIQYMEHHQFFVRTPLVPADGFIALPTEPGLGIVLDESKIESREERAWD